MNRFSGKTANYDADKVRKEHKAMREPSFPSTLFAYTKSKIWYTGWQEFEGSALDHRSAKPKYKSNKKSKTKAHKLYKNSGASSAVVHADTAACAPCPALMSGTPYLTTQKMAETEISAIFTASYHSASPICLTDTFNDIAENAHISSMFAKLTQ